MLYSKKKTFTTNLLGYLVVCVLTAVTFFWVTQIHQVNWAVPFNYKGDSLECIAAIKKTITGNKWGHLYAPFQFDHEQPRWIATVNVILQPWIVTEIKLISLFTEDPVKILNIYYFLTYILTSLTFAYVLRYCRISWYWVITFSLLFSLLPYHFMRNVWHLWVGSYYLIPLYILLLLWIWKAVPIFFKYQANKFRISFINKKSIFAFVVLVILSPTIAYYNFMFFYLAIIAGIGAGLYRNNSRHLMASLILATMAAFSLVKGQIPSWLDNDYFQEQIQRIKPGQNIASHGDAEAYGLKIVQMLLPVDDHRLAYLALFKDSYNRSNPLVNENSTATLGIIGSIGFVLLMLSILQHKKRLDIWQKFGLLTIFSILFATIGGGSSLLSTVSYFLAPESSLAAARAFNRISVFIAGFSFFAMAYVLHKTFCCSARKYFMPALVSSLLLLIGVFDQTNDGMKIMRGHEVTAHEYESDKAFFGQIEGMLEPGAMIFQLPYFVHHTPQKTGMYYTEALKGYINTKDLVWTYGGDANSYHSYWYRKVSNLPADEMIDLLRVYGFRGVTIDRAGYKDNGRSIEEALSEHLNQAPKESENRNLSFFEIEAEEKPDITQRKKMDAEQYSEYLFIPRLREYLKGKSEIDHSGIIQSIYIAYHGRPADPDGLAYWGERLAKAKGDLHEMTSSFEKSKEDVNRFGDMGDAQIINNLYQNLFNRDAKSIDLRSWEGRMTDLRREWTDRRNGDSTGAMEYALLRIALEIISQARGADLITVYNKLAVAKYFTDRVMRRGVVYDASDISVAVAIMKMVEQDYRTVKAAKARTDVVLGTP